MPDDSLIVLQEKPHLAPYTHSPPNNGMSDLYSCPILYQQPAMLCLFDSCYCAPVTCVIRCQERDGYSQDGLQIKLIHIAVNRIYLYYD